MQDGGRERVVGEGVRRGEEREVIWGDFGVSRECLCWWLGSCYGGMSGMGGGCGVRAIDRYAVWGIGISDVSARSPHAKNVLLEVSNVGDVCERWSGYRGEIGSALDS